MSQKEKMSLTHVHVYYAVFFLYLKFWLVVFVNFLQDFVS